MPETTEAIYTASETTATTVFPYMEQLSEEAEANPVMLFFIVAVLLSIAFLALKGGMMRKGCGFCSRGGDITVKWKSGPDEDTRRAKYCPMCRRRLDKK